MESNNIYNKYNICIRYEIFMYKYYRKLNFVLISTQITSFNQSKVGIKINKGTRQILTVTSGYSMSSFRCNK